MSEFVASTDAPARSVPRVTSKYTRYVFFVMFAISLLNYLDRYMLSGAINVISRELGLTIQDVGYISSAFLVVYTLGTLPLGIWADRAKRKDVVAVCVAAWSLITAFTALANSFTTLFLTRMLLGIGEAGYFPAGTALMSDYYQRSVRSRVLSWWSTAQVFGILFGTALGGVLAGLYTGSWRLGFLIVGIPGLIFAFLAWRLREPRRNQADEEARAYPFEEPSLVAADVELAIAEEAELARERETVVPLLPKANVWAEIKSILRVKTVLVLTVMQIFAYFVVYVCVVFLSTFLQQKDGFHMSSGLAGIYSGGIIALAGMFGTIAGGYLSDLVDRSYAGARVLISGIGFLLAAPALVATLTTHDLTIFTIFFIVTCFLITFYQGPSTAALTDVVLPRLRATAVCVTLLIAHLLGDAFSPSVVGVLAGALDPTHGGHFAQNIAAHDLGQALLITCTPALIIAGLVGIFGSRWMGTDVAEAERTSLAAS
jgi:MFS transporter, Spinster family, sphingosine-1-phosphate transporter